MCVCLLPQIMTRKNITCNDFVQTVIQSNVDCLMHIFSHLTTREKVRCRLVSKSWKSAVDKMFAGQQNLEIILCKKNERDAKTISNSSVVIGSKMKFQSFHKMLSNFPSVQSLTIKDLPLNDVLMLAISTTCRNLSEIKFYSCSDNNKENNNDYQLTSYGWQLIIRAYPNLKCLTIRNCSLTESDCELIINGLSFLKRLDISNNDSVTGECLSNLGKDFFFLNMFSFIKLFLHTIFFFAYFLSQFLKRFFCT